VPFYSLMAKQVAGDRRDETERNLSRTRETLCLMTLKHRSKLQLVDCKQNGLKSLCAPWRGLSYEGDSIVSDM
jgi:hypothetical protein